MKKKICMIVPSFTAKGGITSVVNGYIGSNIEKEYDLKYIESYCDGNKLQKILKAVYSYIQFIFLLLFWHPDIVHIHSSFGASFYRKLPFINLAYFFNIKIVNHIHGSYYDELYFNATNKKKNLIEKTWNKSNKLITLSDKSKSILSKIVDSEKIVVNENFGVINILDDDIYKKRICSKTVLFLGFISEKKGCLDIPNIVEKVVSKVPDIMFVVAGSGDIDKVKCKSTKKVLEHIQFPGWIRGEDKKVLLENAGVFFLPSYSEGMPMSILEAMGYELPIVSTDVGGIPNIVHSGINGYTFTPGDTDGMADAIIELFQNDELRLSMGKKSLEIIEQEYSLEKHIEKIIEVYEEL